MFRGWFKQRKTRKSDSTLFQTKPNQQKFMSINSSIAFVHFASVLLKSITVTWKVSYFSFTVCKGFVFNTFVVSFLLLKQVSLETTSSIMTTSLLQFFFLLQYCNLHSRLKNFATCGESPWGCGGGQEEAVKKRKKEDEKKKELVKEAEQSSHASRTRWLWLVVAFEDCDISSVHPIGAWCIYCIKRRSV